jgi:hypothetical protein
MSKSSKKHRFTAEEVQETQPKSNWLDITTYILFGATVLIVASGLVMLGAQIGSKNERKKIASASPFPAARPEWNRYKPVTDYTNRMPKGVKLLQSNSGTWMIEDAPGSFYYPIAGFKTQQEAIAEAWQSVLRAAEWTKMRYITDHAMPLEFSEVVTRDYIDQKADRQFVTNVVKNFMESAESDDNGWIRRVYPPIEPNRIFFPTNDTLTIRVITNYVGSKTNRIFFNEDFNSDELNK